VIVRGSFTVERAGADNEVDGENMGVGYVEWVLVERATLECAGWMMPFVKRQFDSEHNDLVRLLVEKIQWKVDQNAGKSAQAGI